MRNRPHQSCGRRIRHFHHVGSNSRSSPLFFNIAFTSCCYSCRYSPSTLAQPDRQKAATRQNVDESSRSHGTPATPCSSPRQRATRITTFGWITSKGKFPISFFRNWQRAVSSGQQGQEGQTGAARWGFGRPSRRHYSTGMVMMV